MAYPVIKRNIDIVMGSNNKIDKMEVKLHQTVFKYNNREVYKIIDSRNTTEFLYNLFKNNNDIELWIIAMNKLTQKIKDINENNTGVLEDIKNDMGYILVYDLI